jgi:hypothetical protein
MRMLLFRCVACGKEVLREAEGAVVTPVQSDNLRDCRDSYAVKCPLCGADNRVEIARDK